jgi:hypothetical protein
MVEPEEMSTARQRLGKQVSAATHTQATMFYVRSVQSGHKRRALVNWYSAGNQPVKGRLLGWCEAAASLGASQLRVGR